MAVKIGHASVDERGKIQGGTAGDQTGKEVCTRDWYAKGWTVLLRPKTAALAEKLAKACEAGCANNKIGYDQNQRNTLRAQARKAGYDLSRITTACECDCSSFMTVCAEAAGVNMDSAYSSGNAPTTSTMQAKFTAIGQFDALTDKKYLTASDYLKRGDILVKKGSHTVMVLSNGAKVSSASTVSVSAAKTYTGTFPALPPRGYYLPGDGYKTLTNYKPQIKRVQEFLNWAIDARLTIDGQYGPATETAVRAFQKKYGLKVDGSFGLKSLAKAKNVKK